MNLSSSWLSILADWKGKLFPFFCLVALWFMTIGFPFSQLIAQSEAQAGQEVLVLQKAKTGKTLTICPGDRINFPVTHRGYTYEERAELVEVKGDNEIVVRTMGKQGEVKTVDLSELAYFRRVQSGRIFLGWALVIAGTFLKIALTIWVLLSFLGSTFTLIAVLAAILFFGLEPFSLLLLIPGYLFVLLSRRKFFHPKWSWKMKRMMRVKEK